MVKQWRARPSGFGRRGDGSIGRRFRVHDERAERCNTQRTDGVVGTKEVGNGLQCGRRSRGRDPHLVNDCQFCVYDRCSKFGATGFDGAKESLGCGHGRLRHASNGLFH